MRADLHTEQEREIRSLIERYIGHFNAQEFEAALSCYRLPFTWLFGEPAATAATPEEFLSMMRRSSSELRAKGLARSVLRSTTVRLLSDHVALAGVVVARLGSDDSELASLGGTYLVHKGKEGWQLVAYGAHAIEAIVPAMSSG